MDTTIPCDICTSNIEFSNYIQHCEECYIQQSMNNNLQRNIDHGGLPVIVGNNVITSRIIDIEVIHQILNRSLNRSVNMSLFDNNDDVGFVGSVNEPVHVPVNNFEECYTNIDYNISIICNICLEDSVDLKFIKTNCNHTFCIDCLRKWLSMKHKCPVCQHDFNL